MTQHDASHSQPQNQPTATEPKDRFTGSINLLLYEVPKADGHKATAMDSFRSVLGRVYEFFDESKNAFEYTFKDKWGKLEITRPSIDELIAEIRRNKRILLHQAYLDWKQKRQEEKDKIASMAVKEPSELPLEDQRKDRERELKESDVKTERESQLRATRSNQSQDMPQKSR